VTLVLSLSRNGFGALAASQVLLLVGGARIATTFLEIDCPIRSLTGLECPGCGSTRCVTALGAGDLAAGFRHNPLLASAVVGSVLVAVCGAISPGFVSRILSWVNRRSRPLTWGMFAVIVKHTVMRNL